MDDLEREIDNLKKRILKWKKAIADSEGELAGMEKAAKLRPAGANASRRPPDAESDASSAESGALAAGKPGRRQGAISAQWREVLSILYIDGGPHSYDQIHKTALATGRIDVRDIASTRDRVRGFIVSNLMTGNAETGFTVTEVAAAQLGFNKTNSAPPVDDFTAGADKVEGA